MNSPAIFARSTAFSRRRFTAGRASSFAKWFLRHRGPAPAASTSRYQFVYHLARHLRESSTLRVMSPLNLSQVTYAPVTHTVERWMHLAPAAMRDVLAVPSSISRSPGSLWRVESIRPESARPSHLRPFDPTHSLLLAAPVQTTTHAASRFLAAARDSRSTWQPGAVQRPMVQGRDIERNTLVLRTQTVSAVSPSKMHSGLEPTTSTRSQTRTQERVFATVSALAPVSPGSLAPGSTAAVRDSFVHAVQPGVANSTRSFFSSWVTAPFTLLNNYFAGTEAFSAVGTRVDTRIFEGAPVPFAMATIVPSAAPETRFTPIAAAAQDGAPSLSFALRLPGTRTIRELQSSPGMILSVRPEQVLATANTSYVYAQQPRPVAADPGSSLAGDRREIVNLVQKEVRNAMSSGAVVQHFTRHDYASITDQVESLLRRRLVVEKERLGFPS